VFQPFDVQLLDALAQAAAVAIVNARLYAAEHESRLRLEALNDEIRSQRDQLERRLQVQDSLADVVQHARPLRTRAPRLGRIADARHRKLDAVDSAAADSAAMIAAARFLRERALEEGEIRRRGDVVERLLNGDVPAGADALRQAQVPLRLVVGTLRAVGDTQHDSAPRVLRAMLALTQEKLALDGRPVTVALKDGHVVAIQSLAGRPAGSEEPSLAALEQAAERLKALAPEWRAVYAVQDEVAELTGLAPAHHEARLAIQLREKLGRAEPVFRVRSLGAFRLILQAASRAAIIQVCHTTRRSV